MGTRLGRYDVIRTLARGSLSDLLLGCASGEAGFQRHVAIKALRAEHAQDPACLEMFVNEARLAAALHHHNIVQVTDIGETDGQPWFAMEYVHGVDLRKLLNHLAKRNEQLPLQHVVQIAAAAAAALHHAHEQRGPDGQPLGIVHRQVTPANILVGFDGNVKIVDFGIAKAAIKRMQTGVGVLKGSAPYMAPEQCAGGKVDRRSDVFALGIVLYEISTVRRLFKGANEFLTMSAVVNGDVPRPSQFRRDLPSELEVVMLKALSRTPLARYQSASDMAEALDQVARTVGVGASTAALANYMKLQFGEVKEPWLEAVVERDPEITDVDFDGAASGLAPPPTEAVKSNAIPKAVAATRSSPIAQARSVVSADASTSDATVLDLPKAGKDTGTERAFGESTVVDDQDAGSTVRATTDIVEEVLAEEPDASATMPATPSTRAKTKAGVEPASAASATALEPAAPARRRGVEVPEDMTAIVEPLHVVVARAQTQASRPRPGKVVWIGVAGAVLVAIIATIVLWPAKNIEPSSAGPGAATPGTATPGTATPGTPLAAKPAPSPPPATEGTEKSALDMTARDYEASRPDAQEAAAVPADAAEVEAIEVVPADAAVEQVAATPPVEPAPEVKPEPPPRPVARKPVAVKKPVAAKKPAAKKTTTKKKPKWNPDDLFLGE